LFDSSLDRLQFGTSQKQKEMRFFLPEELGPARARPIAIVERVSPELRARPRRRGEGSVFPERPRLDRSARSGSREGRLEWSSFFLSCFLDLQRPSSRSQYYGFSPGLASLPLGIPRTRSGGFAPTCRALFRQPAHGRGREGGCTGGKVWPPSFPSGWPCASGSVRESLRLAAQAAPAIGCAAQPGPPAARPAACAASSPPWSFSRRHLFSHLGPTGEASCEASC